MRRSDVRGTYTTLASIQDMMDKLKTLIEKSLPVTSPNMSNEDEPTFGDEILKIDEIAGQTSSIAAECLTVAKSVCGKISSSGSISVIAGIAHRSSRHDAIAISSTVNGQTGRLDSDFDALGDETDESSDSELGEPVEPELVLTDHIDNNYTRALAAIKREEFHIAVTSLMRL